MPSEIAPCPVCGGEGEPAIMDGHARCLDRNGCSMLPLPIADWNRLSRAVSKANLAAALDARVAAFEDAAKRLVLAFDVGDLAHTTLNGRGYAALARLRALLVEVSDDRA